MGGESFVVGEGDDRRRQPRERAGVGAGDRRALEERGGGDAGADVGEAARRQRGRAADHEVGGAERRVLADQDLTGVDDAVDDAVDVGVGDRDLEVLGCVAIDDRDAVVERVDEHAAAVRAERGAGGLGPSLRQRGELLGQLGVGAVGEVGAGGHEHDRGVGAVLGLDQQVGGEPLRVGGVVGEHDALGRAEQHHRGDAEALHLDLGERDRRRAGPDHLAHGRDASRCRSRGRRCRPDR